MTELLSEVVTRKTVPLSQHDLDGIAWLRGDEAARSELGAMARTTVSASASEAALLHAVLVAGFKAVQDRIDADSYAAEAADIVWQEEQRTIARRPRARRGMVEVEVAERHAAEHE
jgi:hypothetical protein